MSASNEWTIYHLTPRGWEKGTEKSDFARTDRPRPVDTVQTLEVRDYLSSSFSKNEHTRRVERTNTPEEWNGKRKTHSL